MKVAFWNGILMPEDTVDYMAAVGIILALEYKRETVLSSSYISNHMLQDCFSGKAKDRILRTPYRFLYGSLEYCRELWSMKGNKKDNVLEVPMEGVTIVYPPEKDEAGMFYHKASPNTFYFLDMAGESGTTFQNVMEEADLLVVFLPQDEVEIQKFFHRFSSIIPNTIFVIEEVQRANRLSYRRLVTEYGVSNKNIACIPRSKEYKEACEEGKLELFLKKRWATKSSQYSFVAGVKSVAKILYERSGCGQRKERGRHKKI